MTITRRKVLDTLLLAAAVPLFAACTHFAARPASQLAGRLWDVAGQRYAERSELDAQAMQARFVLLGEIHDSPAHHRAQAQLLETLLRHGRHPALVMEQFDIDQQTALDAILQADKPEQDKLRGLEGLMRKSWDWRLYAPLLKLALQYQLPVVAANLSREALRKVSRDGYGALGEGEAHRLAIDKVWTPALQAQLLREVDAGHCGKVPAHVIQAIAKAQRARDAVMADALLRFKDRGAVAIIGRGHARQDMGVPLYLAARMPDATLLSLGLIDVDADSSSAPIAYAAGPLGAMHRYLWFTPGAKRRFDPCDTIPAPKPGAQG